MRDTRAALDALARWLVVRAGFEPLARLLPAGLASVQAEGLFDFCLGRWEGADLRVHALMADEGGDPALVARRAELLRAALRKAVETHGESILKGAENFASDLARGGGQLA